MGRVARIARVMREDGIRAALRALRWRVAERIGKALVGGRLDALEDRLRAGEAALPVAVAGVEERRERALTDVVATAAAQDAAVAALRAEHARSVAAVETALATLRARVDEVVAQAGAAGERATAVEGAVAALQAATQELGELSRRHGQSIRWLAERHEPPVTAVDATPELVSIVMPVWNRAELVHEAIASVRAQTYPRWELLVVDDGSDDGTAESLVRYAGDGRIRVLRQPHAGHATARNRGLAATTGGIVAYLDSDNTWTRGYLAAVVAALREHPEPCVYLAQLVHDHPRGDVFVRQEAFDREQLARGNYIDLNVFAHRRTLFERLGGFDEALSRLADWDLILRYTADTQARAVHALGGSYVFGRPDQVSMRESFHLNLYRIRRKLERPLPRPPRVLYALWHYPQLSESYVRTEIVCMRRWGVDVSVWRQEPGVAPYPSEVPVHDGSLADAIRATEPDVVHTHWVDKGLEFRDGVAEAGLPLTVRGHGFEITPARLRLLADDPVVRAVYLPTYGEPMGVTSPKFRSLMTAFNPDVYYPGTAADPALVVRASTGIPTKDLEAFVRIARRCPAHRFVLILCRAARMERSTDEIVAYNRAQGSPVDVRIDVPHEEIGAVLRCAGLYLHTFAGVAPYGMPISIAEAMASGAHCIARRFGGAAQYVGEAGRVWDTEDDAVALIRETEAWDGPRWQEARSTSVERAFRLFADAVTLRPILDDWLRLRARRAA